MSTIAPRRSRHVRSAMPTATADKHSKTARRPLRWRPAAAVLTLLLLVWFLPSLVAHSPLRNFLLGRAVGKLPCQVSTGGASLGWFSPVVLRDVHVDDGDHDEVLSIASVSTEKTLASLLVNSADVGLVRIDEPALTVTCDDHSSNLERLLADYLTDDESSSPVSVSIEILNGAIVVDDPANARRWRIDQLHLSASLPADAQGRLQLKCAAAVSDDHDRGRIQLELSRGAESAAAPGWQLTVRSDTLPLAMSEPLLRRVAAWGNAQLSGQLSTHLVCRWGAGANELVVEGESVIENLSLSCAALGKEKFQSAKVVIPAQIRRRGGQWTCERLGVDCDLGRFSCVGTLSETAGDSAADGVQRLTAWLTSGEYDVTGQLDLARLAAMLPETISLRDQTRLHRGLIDVSMSNRPTADGWTWTGRAEASNLEATVRGQPLVWEQPVRITALARGGPSGLFVEQLSCESEFLQIQGQGNLDSLHVAATYSLDRLAAQLNRFVDLGKTRLAGSGRTDATWRRDVDGRFQATVDSHVRGLAAELAGRGPWQEENLTLSARAAGSAQRDRAIQVESADVSLRSGADQINARLARPVADLAANSSWPIELTVQGSLPTWLARARPWTGPLEDWQANGNGHGTASLVYSPDEVMVERSTLTIADLGVRGPGLNINEPRVQLSARGRWQRDASLMDLEELACHSDAARGVLKGQISRLGAGPEAQLAGSITYDLSKLGPLIQQFVGAGVQLAGRDTCQFRIEGPITEFDVQRIGRLRGAASAGWQAVHIYGVPLGPARLVTRLEDGRLAFDPLRVAVSEGYLHLNPTVELLPGPAVLRMPQGTLVENVRITPEMCSGALAYVAPVLAGVTEAEGRFSVALDGCYVPLDAARRSDVAGRLTVHSVQIGPGPLVRELAVLLGRPAPARLSRESQVTFRMVEGRVYHRDLELIFPDLTIRTHGSVGLDRTLAVMAEMPVPPKWIGENRLGRVIDNRTIRLPIGGTLDQPRIDRRELDRLAAEFLRDTAVDAINDELGKQLDKLFQPRR